MRAIDGLNRQGLRNGGGKQRASVFAEVAPSTHPPRAEQDDNSKTTKLRADKRISLNPFQINHFASVSEPSNTLCLTWGAKPFLRTPPRPLVNASLRP